MRGDENIRGKVFWVLNTYLHALSFRFRSTDETGRHLQTRFLGSGKMQKNAFATEPWPQVHFWRI